MASRNTITEHQNNALEELKTRIQDTLKSHQLTTYDEANATIWGVPLLGDSRSETIILKFLKAKDFRVIDSLSLIKETLRWRAEVCVDTLLEENLGSSYDRVLFTHGYDKQGYPIWYLALEELLNIMLCQISSSDVENQFYCWLIQFVEKNIKKLDFSPGGRNSVVLVIDLRLISSWHDTRDLYKVIYKFLQLLHDHYPGFVQKQLWINVSWWYRYYCRAYCLVFDRWSTCSKTVIFTGESKTLDTLFKYISPAQIPIKYGGLSSGDEEGSSRFNNDEPISEASINPDGKHTLEFSFAEECDVHWDIRVVNWEIIYQAEFVPSMKGRYMTVISKPRKLTPTDRPIISDSYRVSESGKLVITVHNTISKKKKKVVARVRVVPTDGTKVADEASLRGWLA